MRRHTTEALVTLIIPKIDSPSYNAGYGRVQLNKVLNFGVSSNNVSLFVIGAAFQPKTSSKYDVLDGSCSLYYSVYDDTTLTAPPIYVSLNKQGQ